MDPNFTKILLENQRLLKENNQLIHSMRRAAKRAFWFRVIWTAVIILVPILFYFLVAKPYVDAITSLRNDSTEVFMDQLNSFDFRQLLELNQQR